MADYFFDNSAVVKRYVQETGTTWVCEILDPDAENTIYIARITGAEVAAAIAKRRRTGDLSLESTTIAMQQFRSEFPALYRIVEITAAVVSRAMDLTETHKLRGYDAVQLAASLEVNAIRLASSLSSLIFVCADGDLNAAAEAEGLSVENPNTHQVENSSSTEEKL